jgi:hypothetical protein
VPKPVGSRAVMYGIPPAARSSQGPRLRRVTLLVPESCADSLRDLARALRVDIRGEQPARRSDGGASVRAPN